jgi:hypothetical protein
MRSTRMGTTMRVNGTRTRVLAVIGAVALLTLSLGIGSALAGQDARNAHNTFTKWFIGFPNMTGFVDGDVGPGTYSGLVRSKTGTGTAADPILITADYQFNGSLHSFTARVDIVEIIPTATINGVVTDGWLAGNLAQGEFTVVTSCSYNGGGTCFQGYLDILRGTKSDDD